MWWCLKVFFYRSYDGLVVVVLVVGLVGIWISIVVEWYFDYVGLGLFLCRMCCVAFVLRV